MAVSEAEADPLPQSYNTDDTDTDDALDDSSVHC